MNLGSLQMNSVREDPGENESSQFQHMYNNSTIARNESSFISFTDSTKEVLNSENGKKIICSKKLLGKGSFSKVYAGQLCIPVAIKKISWGNMDEEKTKRYIKSEIDIMKGLSHENIVNLFDVICKENDLYLILEECKGGDLKKFLHGRPLKEKYAHFYLKQLASGLQYLRDHDISHRDLKPQNLLLTENNKKLKITDFGFAKIVGSDTLAETMCGSPLYMAPEIMENTPYTIKADLWSVGIIMYEMLFAKYPIKSVKGIFDLIHKLKNTSIISIPDKPRISKDAKDLIRGLLQKNPKKRISWDNYFDHIWFSQDTMSQTPTEKKQKSVLNLSTLSKMIPKDPQESKPLSSKMSVPMAAPIDIPSPSQHIQTSVTLHNSEWDNSSFSPRSEICSTSPFVKSFKPIRLNIIDDYTSTEDFNARYGLRTQSAPILLDPSADVNLTLSSTPSSTEDGSGIKQHVRDYVFASYHLIKDSFRSFHSIN